MDQFLDEAGEQQPRRRGRPRTRGITTQMNVRVDKDLKVRGDEVLRAMGSNPTDIISRLWGFVVRTGTVPDFLTDQDLAEVEEEQARINQAVEEMRGMPWRMLADEGALKGDAPRDLSLADVQQICASGDARRAMEVA